MTLITVQGLRKSYGAREVLHGVNLTVEDGEIVGVLGPNGAGKTTTVECIGGLRTPDAGSIRVAGIDPASNDPRLRQILGMQLQQCHLPAKITPAEALDLFAAFYPDPRRTAELLELFGLTGQADQRFEKLSGGQQQRLSIALALIGKPRVAILDELTTGLDPAARREIWAHLAELRADGVTMLLVTHSMEEAAHLCDRVMVIDGGRVTAVGTPDQLTAAAGRQETSFERPEAFDVEALGALPGVTEVREERGRVVVVGGEDSPQAVVGALAGAGIPMRGLRVTTPSLDDAYLALTETDKDN